MNKNIEAVNFDAQPELIDMVDATVEKLAKYHDMIVSVDVYLKYLNDDINTAIAEMRVFIPGHDIFMEQEAANFTSAVQQLFDKLKVQLAKHKERDKDNRRQRIDKF